MPETWLTLEAALDQLKVRPQTLYAYVSRGQIAARTDSTDPRRSQYRQSDIQRLTTRKVRGRRSEAVAGAAMAWGDPVLASAISTIVDGRLYYRGRDAAALAEDWTFEATAAWLRQDDPPIGPGLQIVPSVQGTARACLFQVLAHRASQDGPARGRAPRALANEAGELLEMLAGAIAGTTDRMPIHERIAQHWGRDEAADPIRRALVLLADHELNASTFAARVTASTGASLAAAALAGLSALSGPLHGGMAARVVNLMEEAVRLGPTAAVAGRLARNSPIPGFGHPLYPDGDPRAKALLDQMILPTALAELQAGVIEATGQLPNIDFALVALRDTYRLPAEVPFTLFALARSAGWLAHAIEQLAEGSLIRPRARYIGVPPLT